MGDLSSFGGEDGCAESRKGVKGGHARQDTWITLHDHDVHSVLQALLFSISFHSVIIDRFSKAPPIVSCVSFINWDSGGNDAILDKPPSITSPPPPGGSTPPSRKTVTNSVQIRRDCMQPMWNEI